MIRTRRSGALLLIALGALATACAAPAPPPPNPPKAAAPDARPSPPTTGRIEIACEPESAKVLVDGQPQGLVSELAAKGGLELPLGLHRIEIAAEGYRTFRLELNLGAKRETIRVKLNRVDTRP